MANNNYVIVSKQDDEGSIFNSGSVRLMNGSTGTQINSALAGDMTNDQLGSGGTTALANNNFVIVSELDDEGGIANAGSVRLADGTTDAQIGNTIAGSVADDMSNAVVTGSPNGDYYILSLPNADNNALVDSGHVRLIAQ